MKLSKTIAGVAAAIGLMFATAAFAQTPPVLNVVATFPTQVNVGAQNATVATFALTNPSATTAVDVRALPLVLANTGLVSNCRVVNVANGAALSSGGNVLSTPGTVNNIGLDSSFSIAPNSGATLSIVCNFNPSTAAGTVLGVALMPGNVFAMAAGATTTSIGIGIPAGTPFAGEIRIGTGTGTPVPPGLPNTGAGGSAPMLYTLLALAALAVGAGAVRLATLKRN